MFELLHKGFLMYLKGKSETLLYLHLNLSSYSFDFKCEVI